MTYEVGAALCFKRGMHRRETWASRCRVCGADLSPAEREEADAIREAMRELRAEQESADLCSDGERDARSHRDEL